MCTLCDQGKPQNHSVSQLGRRDFLRASTAGAVAAAGASLFSTPARAQGESDDHPPQDSGRRGRRYVIRGGHVMSMDPAVGDFVKADVLVEGKKIVAVGPNIDARGAGQIDARGKIVMPGFIDTHHHQAWTAIRSSIPDSILIDDGTGTPSAQQNYFFNVLGGLQPTLPGFANHYRPEDVYISELFGGLSQLDAGVTTVLDISQIHHSRQHSDAAVKALKDTGRRAMLGFFESAGNIPGNLYPTDAPRIAGNLSGDDLVGFVMGGEVYLGNATTRQSWTIGRQLGVLVAAHILSPFGIRPILDQLTGVSPDVPDFTGETLEGIEVGEDNLFIHMTGMSDPAWQKVEAVGAKVSIAFPIEMNMRHGEPPILKMQSFKDPAFEPSLSSDVETNMTADFFTQMRSAMTMQRMVVNQAVLDSGPIPVNPWPPFPANQPPLLNVRDVLRYATINGAKHLRLDSKTGSLTPGKEADIIILDGTHINVFPVNHVPGAVVQMMERSNVETVIVAGKVRKWKGKLLDVNLSKLRSDLEKSRDFLFNAATGNPPNLFR
ncbi:MAG TPA: amidohydrolase family protein [Burkholderiales bacterium]|nr:amidohydrolase family protein [Burkholderiales bacterium]